MGLSAARAVPSRAGGAWGSCSLWALVLSVLSQGDESPAKVSQGAPGQRGSVLGAVEQVMGPGRNSRHHLQASRAAPELPGRAENTLERLSSV